MTDHVLLTEVSLRDGLQIEPRVVPTETKLRLAALVRDAGFTDYEIGSFVRPDRVPTMADTAELSRAVSGLPGARAHALVFNDIGAQRAVASGLRHARLTISASEGHSQANSGVPVEASLQRLEGAASVLREGGVGIQATIATAFVCPFDGPTPVERVQKLVEPLLALGAEVIHLADTIGAAHPGDLRRTLRAVSAQIGESVPLGLHLHNTYGMAPASVWEALAQGVRRFDAAVGGLGGCPFAPGAAGNIGTDDLVHFLHGEGIRTGIDPEGVVALRTALQEAVGHPLDSALSRVGVAPAPLRTGVRA